MNQLTKEIPGGLAERDDRFITASGADDAADSLFERFAWLYILFREKILRDDTERMIRALWPDRNPRPGARLIEFGCGPGFYSCQFAAHFPQISVVGLDSAESQLAWARTKKRALGLGNCSFERGNVLSFSGTGQRFDALVASRLFTVLLEREKAVAEMFRILRPDGRCFVAEPRGPIRANLPLLSMWLLARLTPARKGYREPGKAMVLSFPAFESLFATQPWKSVRTWQDGRYQYALCEKN